MNVLWKRTMKLCALNLINPLAEIDKEFEEEKEMFGVESLKEFIDGYESSRFTQISETEAIITSEYNMNHIVDWIERFAEDMVFS